MKSTFLMVIKHLLPPPSQLHIALPLPVNLYPFHKDQVISSVILCVSLYIDFPKAIITQKPYLKTSSLSDNPVKGKAFVNSLLFVNSMNCIYLFTLGSYSQLIHHVNV